MYDTLIRLKKNGQLTDVMLTKAVLRGWITQAQADEISTMIV